MEKLPHIEVMIDSRCLLNQAAQSAKESYATFRANLFQEIQFMVEFLNETMSNERFNAYISTGDAQQGYHIVNRLHKEYTRYTHSQSVQKIQPTSRIAELTVEEFRLLMADILKEAR